MDHYGIGHAVAGMVRVYQYTARASGRTTSLVESVKDGDRIVFATPKEARRVERLCKERGVKVECITVPPSQADLVFNRGPARGRVIFDHGWVEQYYVNAIERAATAIDELERQSSGMGAAHLETLLSARESAKWHQFNTF
jgi:hypothetical protein